jgi:hypothetical protein
MRPVGPRSPGGGHRLWHDRWPDPWVVHVCEATFTDPSLYGRETFLVAPGSGPARTLWKPVKDFLDGRDVLYPVGLRAVLATDWTT